MYISDNVHFFRREDDHSALMSYIEFRSPIGTAQRALLNTGSSLTLLKLEMADQWNCKIDSTKSKRIILADKTAILTVGETQLRMVIPVIDHTLVVTATVVEQLSCKVCELTCLIILSLIIKTEL